MNPEDELDDAKLTAATGVRASRFRTFDALLAKHHPQDVDHDHLAVLAVDPDPAAPTAPNRLCTKEAVWGTPVELVVAITVGSTRSRPTAHMYRPTAVWNASAAASKLVRNRQRTMLATRPGAMANSIPVPSGPCAVGTTWLP